MCWLRLHLLFFFIFAVLHTVFGTFGLVLLCFRVFLRYHSISGLCIELARHEILICVQVFIEVNDLFNRDGVRAPFHGLFCESASIVFVTTWLHGQMRVIQQQTYDRRLLV